MLGYCLCSFSPAALATALILVSRAWRCVVVMFIVSEDDGSNEPKRYASQDSRSYPADKSVLERCENCAHWVKGCVRCIGGSSDLVCIKFEAFDLLRDFRVMEAVWFCFNPLSLTFTVNNDEFTVSFGV